MSKKRKPIDLSDYYEINEAGEKVLKPFTQTRENEGVLAVIVHNKGEGSVIDVFIGFYQEYLRQQWYHIATDFNERLQEVRDWNKDKPSLGDDENGKPIYPDDRPEPEPPESVVIPSVEQYRQKYKAFINGCKSQGSRLNMYAAYGLKSSWEAVDKELFASVDPSKAIREKQLKILSDTSQVVMAYQEQKELDKKPDMSEEQYKQTLQYREKLRKML